MDNYKIVEVKIILCVCVCVCVCSGVHRNFVRGGRGVQQIQLRTEDRENRDLGAVVPYSGVLEAAAIWYKKFRFI